MSNWNHIVKSVSLASSMLLFKVLCALINDFTVSLMNYTDQDYENKEEPPLPETLVRLRIHDDTEE